MCLRSYISAYVEPAQTAKLTRLIVGSHGCCQRALLVYMLIAGLRVLHHRRPRAVQGSEAIHDDGNDLSYTPAGARRAANLI